MQCKEWDDANSELFKESHDEAVHKNSYKSRLYELISASLRRHHNPRAQGPVKHKNLKNLRGEAPSTILPEPSYNKFGRGRLEDLSLLDLSLLQHEHAFGIMVIGAIEDIPLNPV